MHEKERERAPKGRSVLVLMNLRINIPDPNLGVEDSTSIKIYFKALRMENDLFQYTYTILLE